MTFTVRQSTSCLATNNAGLFRATAQRETDTSRLSVTSFLHERSSTCIGEAKPPQCLLHEPHREEVSNDNDAHPPRIRVLALKALVDENQQLSLSFCEAHNGAALPLIDFNASLQ